MREILFRAKQIENRNWVEGYYIRQDETTYCFKEDYESHPENTKHYIVFDMPTDWGLPNRHLVAEIDPETLCQFTGSNDKNGNRIWENDIVSFIDMTSTESGYCERNCIGRVAWDIEEACFYVTDRLSSESWEVLQDCYAVGNIFDNPELLNGE